MSQYADEPEAEETWAKTDPAFTQFSIEAIINKAQLRETDIQPKSIQWLDFQGLSVGCREAWKKLLISTFDKSKILSITDEKNFSQMESALNLELAMNFLKLQYQTFDLDNPLILQLEQLTRWDFRHILTRTGDGFEIKQQHKFSTENVTTSTQVIKDARGGKKPGRFFGLFG
jgi:hypothetical protein